MQFAYASRRQSHVHTGDRVGDGKFANRDFARPSTFLHSLVRNPKRILEGLHSAGISRGQGKKSRDSAGPATGCPVPER